MQIVKFAELNEVEEKVAETDRQEALDARLAKSRLPALWSKYSETASPDQAPPAGAAIFSFLVGEPGNTMQLGGGHLPSVPFGVYQVAELFRISVIDFSQICGLESLDIAMFMALVGLKDLSVRECPDLLSLSLSALEAQPACKPVKLTFSNNALLMKLPLIEIVRMQSVKELACQGCPNLWSPPQEVAGKGGRQTMEFVRAVFRDGQNNSEMTLFLIGDGEAGKTSVFRALQSPNNAAERIGVDQRTVGIDTELWRAGPSLHFQVFDLAGQAVYETTHQFFLQQRAVYLLVWRAFPVAHDRHHVIVERVQHWMDALQVRVPGARMMLVVTHIDTISEETLDTLCHLVKGAVQTHLARLSGTARGRPLSVHGEGESLRVNCLAGVGIASLRERLVSFAQSAPWYQEPLPRSVLAVREEVSKLALGGTPYISASKWVQIAEKHGLDDVMLPIGTTFLHETGSVRFFGEVASLVSLYRGVRAASASILNETVYISPKFMVSVMKGLIRHDRQALQDHFAKTGGKRTMLRRINRFIATGRLHTSLVPFLWPSGSNEASKAYWVSVRETKRANWESDLWPDDVVTSTTGLDEATNLLVGFDLMVKDSEEDCEYLVPGALPSAKKRVITMTDQGFVCRSERTYDYLPPGLFQRTVVRIAGSISWCEFSIDQAVFNLLGNIATLSWSETTSADLESPPSPGTFVLCWQSTGQELHAKITEAVADVERFYPGLPLSEMRTDELQNSTELIQVLVLAEAASVELSAVIKTAIEIAAAGKYEVNLVVRQKVVAHEMLEPVDSRHVRVVLLCLSHGFKTSEAHMDQAKAYMQNPNIRALVLLLDGDELDKNLFEKHPFFDLRDLSEMDISKPDLKQQAAERVAEIVVENKLLEQIRSLLLHWRPGPMRNSAHSAGKSALTMAIQNELVCTNKSKRCEHTFDRLNCLKMLEEYEEDQGSALSHSQTIACPECQHQNLIRDLIAAPEVRPCPLCKERAKGDSPGLFEARECRLIMAEDHAKRSYALQCSVCEEQVSLFDVFPPEVYVSWQPVSAKGGTREESVIKSVLRQAELEADVLVWMARRGGGDGDAESRWAASLADMVLVLLSEEQAASQACAKEICDAVRTGKPIIPVLLPGFICSPQPPQTGGGKATADDIELFWRRTAEHRRRLPGCSDAVDWNLLGQRMPVIIPVRDGKKQLDAQAAVRQIVSQINLRLHRAVKLDVFSDLSRSGVRVSYFKHFIRECKGREALQGKTTGEVMKLYVKPDTEKTRLSWCDHLASSKDGRNFVSTAEVFLSHAWAYPFLEVVDAVERHFLNSGKDPFIWFDVFSVSQHKSQSRDFHWWQSTFFNAVGAMGHVLMVMHPWDDPTTLKRAWCIFEAYSCEATQSKFSVAITAAESNRLVTEICKDPLALFKMLRNVSCEASQATVEADKIQIFESVQRSVGFTQIDYTIFRTIEEAVHQEIHKLFTAQRSSTVLGAAAHSAAELGLTLGNLFMLKRRHEKAKQLFQDCLEISSKAGETAGSESQVHALRATLGLAVACSRLEQREGSIAMYEQCRTMLGEWKATGSGSFGRAQAELEVMSGLAVEYQAAGFRDKADDLAKCCLAGTPDLHSCGAALQNLARLRLAQGLAPEAQELLLECLEARKREFGLSTKNHYDGGDCRRRDGVDSNNGNSIAEDVPTKMQEVKQSLWHPATLDTIACMAEALELQEKRPDAVKQRKELLAVYERYLGPEHRDTRKVRDRLSELEMPNSGNSLNEDRTGTETAPAGPEAGPAGDVPRVFFKLMKYLGNRLRTLDLRCMCVRVCARARARVRIRSILVRLVLHMPIDFSALTCRYCADRVNIRLTILSSST